MIQTKEQLRKILQEEFSLYFSSKKDYVKAYVLNSERRYIWKFQSTLRKMELLSATGKKATLRYAWYSRKINSLSLKLGISMWHSIFMGGLRIYHPQGIVVNTLSKIGKNCSLHGNNCIGNDGKHPECPVIGDNCNIGVGAIIIGNVKIGNNVTIAAGAVVNKSFSEDNILLAGIPAEIVKHYKCE